MGRTWVVIVIALLSVTPAQAGERADMEVRFAERAPSAPTALTLHLRYKAAGDPEAKPSPIRLVALRLPEGTGLPLATYPSCDATDDQLETMGTAACPPESRIGEGSLSVITGFGAPVDPLVTDVSLFSMRTGILELVSERATGATLAVERLTLEDGWLVGRPAVPPGGPPDGASGVRDIDWTVPAGYFVTPPRCGPRGEWVTRGRFRFEDGVSVEEAAVTPCEPAHGRLIVRRRDGRAEVRLPTTPRCRAGAIVRVGSRERRTDARGRAVIPLTGLAAGRHAVSSRRDGCFPRAGWLVVRDQGRPR